VSDILELMDLGLLGRHIADLVSSGASLHRVKDALEKVSRYLHKLCGLVDKCYNHHAQAVTRLCCAGPQCMKSRMPHVFLF
jgi:hypoxanthine-guanine phosphoribosyltransferase